MDRNSYQRSAGRLAGYVQAGLQDQEDGTSIGGRAMSVDLHQAPTTKWFSPELAKPHLRYLAVYGSGHTALLRMEEQQVEDLPFCWYESIGGSSTSTYKATPTIRIKRVWTSVETGRVLQEPLAVAKIL